MRVVPADERDSMWERDDPRFRVFVFRGADNAVSTIDVTDATVEQALEAARTASENDEHLWSLALVNDDSAGMPGLVWLSGIDYNTVPSTPRQWRRRRKMQERYLSERSRRGDVPLLPNGLRLIRLFPEWVPGWPLWESFTDEYKLTGDDLGLTQPLSDALYEWNDEWKAREIDDLRLPDGWLERGDILFTQLQSELAGIAEVRPDYLH